MDAANSAAPPKLALKSRTKSAPNSNASSQLKTSTNAAGSPSSLPFASSEAVFVIDASAFVFRAYYALQPLSSKGRPSHAVMGFGSMLLKLLREKRPKSCVIVFDSKKPTFRKEMFTAYKANREVPPEDLSGQISAVMEMCRAAELPLLQEEGYEADDFIASLVHRNLHIPIVIVSTDKDLTQLVSENVLLYDSFRERFIGNNEVQEKWGVHPSKMHDLLSLTGDTSDNIPGIPGIGPKTAAQLLNEYGSIDAIIEKKDSLPEKWKLKIFPHLENLKLSRKLVELKRDLDLPFAEIPLVPNPFPPTFKNFLINWDCHRLAQQLERDVIETSAPGAGPTNSTEAMGQGLPSQLISPSADLQTVSSIDQLKDLEAQIRKVGEIIFDVETDSNDRFSARLVGLAMAFEEGKAWYLPYRHQDSQLPLAEVEKFIRSILEDPKIRKIAHHLKYDSHIALKEGISLQGQLDDTMVAAHLLYADRRSFSLANLSRDFLGEEKGDFEGTLKQYTSFGQVPLSEATRYAAQDAALTFKLHRKFASELRDRPEVMWLYREVEIPLAQVLGKMEAAGIRIDSDYLKRLSTEFHESTAKIVKEIYDCCGEEFNVASPKQLQAILFEKLKLPTKKRTKTGFSTDESVLEDLATQHPVPKLILEHRSLTKLLSTYIDVLPTLVHPSDGRLHTNYHQTGTSTGRLSSSDPNLQNIPIRTEAGMKIRKAFVADQGFELLSADYSQVELRLFAAMSEDHQMMKAFQEGRDIHSETARAIFGNEDREARSRAKTINFAIIYGVSAFGLAKQLETSRTEAASFMEAYFRTYPKLKEFMDDLVERARKVGYTQTLFGRRRPLGDILSKNPTLRSMAERIAINAPVQGTAADIMKAAMVRISRRMEQEKLKSRLLLQVHDELVLEVSRPEKDQVLEIVTSEMSDFSQTPLKSFAVPLTVDSSFAANWADAS